MGWASKYITSLTNNLTVKFRPQGNSMAGRIESGQLCTIQPVDASTLSVNDIVLCKVNGNEYLHLIKAIKDNKFQIGNNKGRINGWIDAKYIYGKLIKIED